MSHSHDDERYPVRKSAQEWREQLTPNQFAVTREAATERAFSGRYWNHFEPGRYTCIACGALLFDARSKFDAGCGWPSYGQAVNAQAIERVHDASLGMDRVEVRCGQCGSHLGHVFDDGPPPIGERFCINSLALDFAPDR